MPDNFFNLPKQTQQSLLMGAESRLNTRAFILEKDIWLCWILNELFTLPATMTFKGGTSLSKVYDLIKRFSEDIDITIDYRNFSKETDLDKPISKTALKNLSERLKIDLKQYVQNNVIPHLQKQLKNNFPKQDFKITLSEDGEQLKIYYPSLLEQPDDYLYNYLLLEFGGRNSTEPSESHTISPLLNKVVTDLEIPTAKVKVLSPLRTFWEKATLIHVECNRGRLLDSPERLSRHWYDLAMLAQTWVGKQALTDQKLLEDVLKHKTAFFNASYARYEDCLNGGFKLIPNDSELSQLKIDFTKMQTSGMFSEEPSSFDRLVIILGALERQINMTIAL